MADIIIIDDDPGILQFMKKLCERMGHETQTYQSGREGMAAIGKNVPDVVVVDLRIGDMTGLEIIERCRVNHPDLALIMVTGYGTVETAVEAMKQGAFDYLTKPFEPEDLQRTIN
ncbi:MAG: response regulator, partial [Verrucomicrobiota bacterium]